VAKCPACGAESPSQARFCRSCGTRLGAEAQPTSSPSRAVAPEQRAQRLLEEAFRQAEQGRTLAAIQTCQQAIAINPNSTSAHSLLGTLYERQGDREKAIREYEQVLGLSPDSTVERRRLNELMGVPAAREGVSVSPRVARLVVTGAFAVVIVVVGVAVLLTTSRSGPRETAGAARGWRATASPSAPLVPTSTATLPAPGQAYLGRLSPAPPPIPPLSPPPRVVAPAGMPMRRPTMAPNAYAAAGAARYYGSSGGTVTTPVPMAGAVAYRGGTPVVMAPESTTNVSWPVSAQAGRSYYLQGDYQQAAQAYRSYLSQNPSAGGAPREELAWIYMEMGDRQQATQEYQNAIAQYQADVQRGLNVEAARHGLRTCESAVRALEGR
jgi:tetratricopeptide (TPR) repeat protein